MIPFFALNQIEHNRAPSCAMNMHKMSFRNTQLVCVHVDVMEKTAYKDWRGSHGNVISSLPDYIVGLRSLHRKRLTWQRQEQTGRNH